jgi:sterol desaturase/sphingolipid hydroxylase (fatty acid hydroxylase superfamily)
MRCITTCIVFTASTASSVIRCIRRSTSSPARCRSFLLGLPAIAIQLIVQHSNVDYTLGPFQKILAIGPVHRLHHVNWAGEGDVNFGLLFTAWDRLLGTFKLPHGRKATIGDIGIQD